MKGFASLALGAATLLASTVAAVDRVTIKVGFGTAFLGPLTLSN